MRKQFFSLIILLGFIPHTMQAQGKKERAVAAATEALRMAMIGADQAALERLVSGKLSYGHSSGLVENKQEFIRKLVSGASDFVTIDHSEQTISISGKTGIVRHILKATTNDGGKPGSVQLRILLVWQKENGTWKLLARQAVRLS